MKRVNWRIVAATVVLGVAGFAITAAATRPEMRKRLDALLETKLPWTHEDQGELSHDDLAPVEQSKAVALVDDGWCAAHNRPELACPLCVKNVDDSSSRPCLSALPKIGLAEAATARIIGLEYGETRAKRHVDRLIGNAEISYATHAYAEVRPRVAGRITKVLVEEGETVKAGDLLLIVDSADVGTAKALYLGTRPIAELAQQTFDRTDALVRSDAVAQRLGLEAKAALNIANANLLNASQRLLNLGFTRPELEQINQAKDTTSQLRILAPMSGVLVMRHAVVGEAVEPVTLLFSITDTKHMWCWIDVYETEIGQVRVGQDVSFTIAGTEEPVYHGKVELIDFEVNATTRTIRVRAALENPDDGLRANQFGTAVIALNEPHEMVVVPTDAVQTDGAASVVFIPESKSVFRPQRIVVKPCDEPGMTEVAWGMKPGETVVTTGSFLLRTELLKHQQPQ
jgi:cobalt-zinc-cadmium efflux system membrane fusion protein